jgi:hypothetical protein
MFRGEEWLEVADYSLLKEKFVIDLRMLVQFPDIFNQTLKTLESTTVFTYLFWLTHQLSSGNDTLKVVNAPKRPQVTPENYGVRGLLNSAMQRDESTRIDVGDTVMQIHLNAFGNAAKNAFDGSNSKLCNAKDASSRKIVVQESF